MRILGFALALLIVLIQYPLWVGKGGWLKVWELDGKVAAQKAKNAAFAGRNATLAAEVIDLKHGSDAIEERARYELGMIRKDEVFYQFVDPPASRK